MPYKLSPGFGLDGFLRLRQASPSELQSALRALLGEAGLRCRVGRGFSQGPAGGLSALPYYGGTVLYLDAQQRLRLDAWSVRLPVWAHPVAGSLSLFGPSGECLLETHADSPRKTVLLQGTSTLELAAGSQVLLLVPATTTAMPVYRDLPVTLSDAIAHRIDAYLFRMTFCQDYGQALIYTQSLFADLKAWLTSGELPLPAPPPSLDRRLQRAVEKMQLEPEWAFDLSQLARYAGASERNLYYLMKRQTGLTPYRFYQRCRLLRVRRRLVDCQSEEPHISWYAADEGFSHLGRFAALYRQQFGELPSETVQWRRRLLQASGPARDTLAVS